MYSKSILLNLIVLSFFCIFLHSAKATNPLHHFCFNQENYTTKSLFGHKLRDLLNVLPIKVAPTGFGVGSRGQLGQDQVNGLALCRGDVSSKNCKTCVINAKKQLRERCPYNRGAIIWYDNCLLKYSDAYFFGQIDSKNKFSLVNVQDVENPKWFNTKVQELLSSLAYKASGSAKLYATGELKLEASEKLYGLAQCTRDLSGFDCNKCLA